MNMWWCIGLGIGLAILYKVYQNYKNKKIAEQLKATLEQQAKQQNENQK